jgi:hypothetical protein
VVVVDVSEQAGTEGDVIVDRSWQHDAFLMHQNRAPSQQRRVDGGNILAVQQDTPIVRVNQPVDAPQKGRFTAARCANEG